MGGESSKMDKYESDNTANYEYDMTNGSGPGEQFRTVNSCPPPPHTHTNKNKIVLLACKKFLTQLTYLTNHNSAKSISCKYFYFLAIFVWKNCGGF